MSDIERYRDGVVKDVDDEFEILSKIDKEYHEKLVQDSRFFSETDGFSPLFYKVVHLSFASIEIDLERGSRPPISGKWKTIP